MKVIIKYFQIPEAREPLSHQPLDNFTFYRELTIKSSLKYFLKEGVSLQPLFLMWGLAQIVVLLYYCQLRYPCSRFHLLHFQCKANIQGLQINK